MKAFLVVSLSACFGVASVLVLTAKAKSQQAPSKKCLVRAAMPPVHVGNPAPGVVTLDGALVIGVPRNYDEPREMLVEIVNQAGETVVSDVFDTRTIKAGEEQLTFPYSRQYQLQQLGTAYEITIYACIPGQTLTNSHGETRTFWDANARIYDQVVN